MKTAQPNFLKKGDVVWIVSPAKALPDNGIKEAVEILTSWGLKVKTGKHVYQKFGGFAGTDSHRIEDVQTALNDPQAKAIFFARGGYGSVRILHQLNWDKFNQNLKWLVGFSDITYFHLFANWQLGLATLHGTMPLEITYEPERKEAISKTKEFLFGELKKMTFDGNNLNIVGEVKGQIIGGNLNILHGYLVGRDTSDFFTNKILFIEDVGEELYALDRMLWNLKSSGVLKSLKALLVGGFTNIKDTNNWFPNQNIEDLILDIFEPLHIPIAFGIEVGHIKNNNPIPMSNNCAIDITKTLVKINFD